jgi:Zn-dependent peptidase ImmA (M78 family)
VTFIEPGVKSIGVNSAQPPTRRRFSIAHEIGHYLHGHEDYDESKVLVEERRGSLSAYDRQEQEANEFAAELLMPLFLLRQDVRGAEIDVPALGRRYQVSEQAMWIQLFDHRLVSRAS